HYTLHLISLLYSRLGLIFFKKHAKSNRLSSLYRHALRLSIMRGVSEKRSNQILLQRLLCSRLGLTFFLRNGKSRTDGTVIEYRIKKVEDSPRIINNQEIYFAGMNYGSGGAQ
ncbi:MAG: hypothetical protein LC687_03910, partial [Actinobacteria bacterium]|nr:hypothetical protein [Actinomycetota bacterium]